MNSETIRNVLSSLDLMWKGMAGLFLVSGFVMLSTMAIKEIVKKIGRGEG